VQYLSDNLKNFGVTVEQGLYFTNMVTGSYTLERTPDRFGLLQPTSLADHFLLEATIYNGRRKSKSLSCYKLDEPFVIIQDYWYVRSENQYWLKKSLLRIEASGLNRRWNEWSFWQA